MAYERIHFVPDDIPGLIWKTLTPQDEPALSALVTRIEARDNPPYRTSSAEIIDMLSETGTWQGVAGYATIGVEKGHMIAFTHIDRRPGVGGEFMCQGGVDPHFRRLGIGAALVRWQTQAAQVLCQDTGEVYATIVMTVDPHHVELENHLKDNGYRWSRSFNEMRADLHHIPKVHAIDPYMVIEQWSDQWEEPVREKVNSLSQLNGQMFSPDDWVKGRTGFVPQWSFVAYDIRGDRPRVAGYLHASKYEQDWAALGWREGYIDTLTVFHEWRHAGLAEALIVASMNAQAKDGMERIGTGVSSEGHSQAHTLYDFLGFRTVGQLRLYTKTIVIDDV